MANRVVEEFDKQIQILEARAAAMNAIREALAQDPDFVTVIQEILLEPDSNGKPAPERAFVSRVPDVFNYERMIHGMLENGNKWLAIREISRMTLITRGCINNVLYTGGHRNLFEEQEISPSRIVWRVSPKAGSMPNFPASCLPPIRKLYPDADDPVETEQEEVVATRPNVIPIRSVPAKVTQKVMPKSKYAPAMQSRRSPSSHIGADSAFPACRSDPSERNGRATHLGLRADDDALFSFRGQRDEVGTWTRARGRAF